MCSRHFKPADFKWTSVRKTLKRENILSMFDWAKEVTHRRQLFKRPLPGKRQKVKHVNIDDEDP